MTNLKKKAWLFLALFALLTLLPLSAAKVKADEKSPAASGHFRENKGHLYLRRKKRYTDLVRHRIYTNVFRQ